MRVAVAMSGGVDSSVAAALAVEKYGRENVFGVTMKLFCYGEGEAPEKSCCSLDAIDDAKSVCSELGIPHYVINLEKEFQKEVIDDFLSQYKKGYTPNPCVRCNQFIKFQHLLAKVRDLKAEKLITGHYSRVIPDDKYHLLKGIDTAKDQSYFLYNLTQEELHHVEFPLGELTKTETRKIASKLKLKTAKKTESQDICFVPSSVEKFLTEKSVDSPGKIVDVEGNVVGRHRGFAFYTIGQRKGLGGGFKDTMYVIALNTEKNEVVIGPEKYLFQKELKVKNPHWIAGETDLPQKFMAKIRYQTTEAECTVKTLNNSQILVIFDEPQKAITPGQSIVFYSKNEVVGGGLITP